MFWSSILPNLMTQSTTFQWSYPESSRQHLDMSLIQIMLSFVQSLSLRHTWHHTSSSWLNLSSRLLLWGIWKVSLLCTELCSRLKVFIKVWLRAEKVPQQPRREPQNTVWMAMKGFSLSSPLLSMHLLMQKVSLFCVKYSTYFIEDKFRCFIDQWPCIVRPKCTWMPSEQPQMLPEMPMRTFLRNLTSTLVIPWTSGLNR